MSIFSPDRSGAVKLISSSTRSITVCSRRAPMFSTVRVDLRRDVGDRVDRVVGEVERRRPRSAISATYCLIRLASGSVRMRRKSSSVSDFELDADRQAALQFGQQVGRLGDVERARGDEQDMVGLHRAMLGGDRRAFDQRQQIALHAFARDVAAAAPARARRSCRSRRGRRCRCSRPRAMASRDDRVLVEQLVGFLGDQRLVRVAPRSCAAAWCGCRTPCRTCRRC